MRRQVTVREYQTREGVFLERDEVQALRSYAPKLQVRPSWRAGQFDLTATSWVGIIQAGDLALCIVPKLPMQRVFFLISYALDPDAWRDELFDFADDTTLVEALAPGFVRQAQLAVRRGLIQGYQVREDALLTVKGHVRFGDQIRQRFGRMPPVEVTYDDFTEDVIENRILLAAVERLLELPIRSMTVRRQLRGVRWALSGVTRLEYRAGQIPSIRFTQLNEHYRPAIRIAELVLAGTSIQLEHGGAQSSGLLLDMNVVFEEFVRVALREALGATQRSFPSPGQTRRLWLAEDRRVRLKPDLSWWVRGRPRFVGDAKYKKTGSSGAENADVYQVLAYATATGLDSAMLVYAEGRDDIEVLRISACEKSISVAFLDLDVGPEELLRQLAALAGEIRGNRWI